MTDRKDTTPTSYLVAPKKEATKNDRAANSEYRVVNPGTKRNESIQSKTHWFRIIIAFGLHLTVTLFLSFYLFFLVCLMAPIFSWNIKMPDDLSDFTSLVTITFPFVLLAATLITFNFRLGDLVNKIGNNGDIQ